MEFKKVAISSEGQTLQDRVDPRFGRANYFIFYDLEDNSWQAIPNPAAQEARGAGIAAASFVVEKGVDIVITGHCGPKAFSVLETAGLKVASFLNGTVEEALNLLKQGKLSWLKTPSVGGHFVGGGGGRGKGRARGGQGKGGW